MRRPHQLAAGQAVVNRLREGALHHGTVNDDAPRSQQTSDTRGVSLSTASEVVGGSGLAPQVKVSTLRLDLSPDGEAPEYKQSENQ